MTNHLTLDELKKSMPSNMKGAATQNLVDVLNNIGSEEEVANIIREKFVTHTSVLSEGRYKINDYLFAIAYVAFKHMGLNNKQAYARTFPDRWDELIAAGRTEQELGAYVAGYTKGKLVSSILEQSMIAPWLLHQDAFNKAVAVQFDLMQNANSEKVKQDAANSLLTHLKRPEKMVSELNVNVNTNAGGLQEMQDQMNLLAERQLEIIQSGAMKTIDVTAQVLIPAEKGDVK